MQTFKRICLHDRTFEDGDKTLTLKRGEEYITTPEVDGEVTVFSRYWAHGIPVTLFAGEVEFTK